MARGRDGNPNDTTRDRQQQSSSSTSTPPPSQLHESTGNVSRGRKLAESTIAQFGGPEFQIDCASTVNVAGAILCKEYRTVFMQHKYSLEMWGPADFPEDQAHRIAEACFFAAVTAAVAGLVLTPTDVVRKLVIAAAAAETALRTCIETQDLLGKAVSRDFSVQLATRHFY